jgi:hypothetical protein
MRVVFSLLFILFTCSLRAADIAFVVYYTKGSITKNDAKTALKKGDQLTEKDRISLSQGAQLILVCRNFETVKLSSKGNYTVKELLKSCSQKKGSFTATYFSYVWEQFTHEHGNPEDDPTHYMKNVGAVSRGCNTVETKLPVDTLIYAAGSLPVYYITTFSNPFLTVFTEPEEGDVLVSVPLNKQPLYLDTVAAVIKNPGIYYWQITNSQGQGCDRNVLKIVSPKEYYSNIALLMKDLPSASAAENAFMKGFILEENHYLAEAFKFYKQAYKLNASNKTYQFAQSRFYE